MFKLSSATAFNLVISKILSSDKELTYLCIDTVKTALRKKKTFEHMVEKGVVLGFNATLTVKVISWQSVMHMCFLAFSHQYTNTTFLSKATNYFSHMILQR